MCPKFFKIVGIGNDFSMPAGKPLQVFLRMGNYSFDRNFYSGNTFSHYQWCNGKNKILLVPVY